MGDPVTLGEKLHALQGGNTPDRGQSRTLRAVAGAANIAILTGLTVLPLWWALAWPHSGPVLAIWTVGFCSAWALLAWWRRPRRARRRRAHFLLEGDHLGAVAALRLDAKTAVIDGNNLYHFGLDEGIGPRAIALIAKHLRADGYRIVCFFDANIFYTLLEQNAFPDGQRHSISILTRLFGLKEHEIYVVPSGVQADKYVLSTLKHMPISFAVTNDRFRDYGKIYGDVMKSNQWRKGVVVKGGELKVMHHRFQTPIMLGAG